MPALSLEQVLGCPSLPSLPTVAVQILELTRDENVKLQAIADLVQHDPALTAKILRTVNSPYYGLVKPCPTIPRAIAYLGLNTVKSLVLSFSLVDLTRQASEGFNLVDYWRRCLYSAAAVRHVTALSGTCDPDEAFVTALMQDVGMLALHAVGGDSYQTVVAETAGDHRLLPAVERDAFAIDHAQVGAALGKRWRLPPVMVEVIRQHHDQEPARHVETVRALLLAHEITAAIILADPRQTTGRIGHRAREWFGFGIEQLKSLTAAAVEDAASLSSLLNVNIGGSSTTDEILTRAEEAFIAHQVSMQRSSEMLREENEELAVLALTDPLTKVGNRKRFDEVLTGAFEAARSDCHPLGMIIIDVDHFKRLNDTYGHDVGDAVLKELAARLERTRRQADVVCRLGGEEFGIVTPNAGSRETALLAEQVRLAIGERPFEVAGEGNVGQALPVTISVGVAVFDAHGSPALSSPSSLVKAADQALYAAKEAGRNQVRVHRLASGEAAA